MVLIAPGEACDRANTGGLRVFLAFVLYLSLLLELRVFTEEGKERGQINRVSRRNLRREERRGMARALGPRQLCWAVIRGRVVGTHGTQCLAVAVGSQVCRALSPAPYLDIM